MKGCLDRDQETESLESYGFFLIPLILDEVERGSLNDWSFVFLHVRNFLLKYVSHFQISLPYYLFLVDL